jgi:hypothetical protein
LDQIAGLFGEERPTFHKQQQQQQVTVEDQLPPADMPTETWVQEHEETDDETADDKDDTALLQQPLEHSFLAPVADLLNFGPPCTRGRYNSETQMFEIIASCSFRKGQEVTFWYSDECDHVMVGIYGFTHPMIPPCPSAEEYRSQAEDWRRRAQVVEEELEDAYMDLEYEREELSFVESILSGCGDCCEYERSGRGGAASPAPSGLRRVRGAKVVRSDSSIERHGIRRMRRDSRNSEF